MRKSLLLAMTMILLVVGIMPLGPNGVVPHAQAQTMVKIGVGPSPSLLFLPLYIAQALGEFSDLSSQGIQIQIMTFNGGADTASALFNKSIDFGNMAIDHSLRSVSQGGAEAKMLATFLETLGLALVVRSDLASQVQSAADLKGKKIGVTSLGSGSQLLGIRLLRQAGLNPDTDVTFVAVGSTDTALAAMSNHTVDAIIHSDPVVTLLIQQGNKLLVDVRTPEGTRALYGNIRTFTGLQAHSDLIAQNPELVSAVVKAYAKAILWIAYHTPDEISQLLSNSGMTDFTSEMIAGNLPGESVTGVTKQEGVNTAIQALIQDGNLPSTFAEPAERFYDNSYLKQAVEELLR